MSEDPQEERAGALVTVLRGMAVDWVLVCIIDIRFVSLASLWQELKMIVGVTTVYRVCCTWD